MSKRMQIFFKKILFTLVLSSTLILQACSDHHLACSEQYDKEYMIALYGGLAGYGLLTMARNVSSEYNIDVQLTVYENRKSIEADQPIMQIQGTGRCENRVMVTRFGGDAGESKFLKVLGGRAESILSPSLLDYSYGSWEIEAIEKDQTDPITIHGFWRSVNTTPEVAQSPQP